MNEKNGSNRPKKKLRQTSIREFVVLKTTTDPMNANKQSIDGRLATTSDANSLNPSLNDNENQVFCATNESVVESDDRSVEAMDCSQTSYLSEIPETPELLTIMSDEEIDCEDETQALNALNRMPDCLLPMPPLRADSKHWVLLRLPLNGRLDCIPRPYPESYLDSWDSRHVKMPNSALNLITAVHSIEGQGPRRTRVSKWELIQENLLSDLKTAKDLEESIKTYNPFVEKYSFDVLHTFFDQTCSSDETTQFFDEILPAMIRLALSLPEIVTQSVPMLRQRQNASLFLSQRQIACLLANAFFCTFPKRSQTNEEYKKFPIINFLSLFTSFGSEDSSKTTKIEKLKCIVNYFRRVIKDMPKGVVSFERRFLAPEELPIWHNSNKALKKLVVLQNGCIEKEGNGLLQVDFANKYIGGGVLGSGCVQEEIRFAICPELIISRLFCEKLLDNEVVLISGFEQFSEYTGYANTFKWMADHKDSTAHDEWGRRYTRIVAIDALYFCPNESDIQYECRHFARELNKAFSGFMQRRASDPSNKCAIASGNWGCGAFNGDPLLKAIIQWMAASQADRDLVLFTFNDSDLKKRLKSFYEFVSNHNFRVKHLNRGLKLYQQNRRSVKMEPNIDLFDFIYKSKELILESN